MKRDYWIEFWRERGRTAEEFDAQTQVLRTFEKRPIDASRWERTVNFIDCELQIDEGARLLDLCCGNGLLATHFAPRCAHVTCVDISPDFVACINLERFPNIDPIVGDMRDVDFNEASFDRVLIYAALQYLSPSEAIEMVLRVTRWLAPGGILYIGDVPDAARRWNFFDTPEREAVHFDHVRTGTAIIGTWFERDWLLKLCRYAGLAEASVVEQPPEMIYSPFRFELVARR